MTPLKVVQFDRSAHFDRSDWNVPFDKIVVPSAALLILLTRTITKRSIGWVGSV